MREEFLKRNIHNLVELKKRNISDKTKIVSLFVSQEAYWRTKFPPTKTNVNFIRIELLEKFI